MVAKGLDITEHIRCHWSQSLQREEPMPSAQLDCVHGSSSHSTSIIILSHWALRHRWPSTACATKLVTLLTWMDHQILWHLLARDTTSSPSPFPFLVQKSLLLLLEGKSHPRTHPKLSPHFPSDSPQGLALPTPLHPHLGSYPGSTPTLIRRCTHPFFSWITASLSSSEIPSCLQPGDHHMPCHLCVEYPSPFSR